MFVMLKIHDCSVIYGRVISLIFARLIFPRNFAFAKFRENKTLAKISEYTVLFLIAYASSEGSDKPALSHSLARAFAARTYYIHVSMKIKIKTKKLASTFKQGGSDCDVK